MADESMETEEKAAGTFSSIYGTWDAEDLRIHRANLQHVERAYFAHWQRVAEAAAEYARVGEDEQRSVGDTLQLIQEALVAGESRKHAYKNIALWLLNDTQALLKEVQDLRHITQNQDQELHTLVTELGALRKLVREHGLA